MKSLIIYAFVASVMYGALTVEEYENDRGLPRAIRSSYAEKAGLLEKYLGSYYTYLQEGNIALYWDAVWRDVQPCLVSFEAGCEKLKNSMLDCWRDEHGRMRWVKNVYEDVIKPVERLCVHDKEFTFQAFLGEAYLKTSEEIMRKNFPTLRTYRMLSDVTTYVSLAPPTENNPLQSKTLQETRRVQRFFLERYSQFFNSRENFIAYIACYSSSNFQQESEHSFIKTERANIRDSLYHLCGIECSPLKIRAAGVCRPQGQILIPERFAAFKNNMLLHDMPYMVKDVDSFQNDGLWLAGSKGVFAMDLRWNRDAMHLAALWRKMYPKEPDMLAYIVEEMQQQVKEARPNVVEMLEIMVIFDSAIERGACANILVGNASELVQSFQNLKRYKASNIVEDILHTLYGQGVSHKAALQYEESLYQKYFIKGVKSIVTKYALQYKPSESQALFVKEYRVTNAAHVWKLVDTIVERCDRQTFLEEALLGYYHYYKVSMDKKTWLKYTRALMQKDLKVYRCTLWDEPFPFLGWNAELKALVVCFPKKGGILPLVMELESFCSSNPITLNISASNVHKLLSYRLGATSSKNLVACSAAKRVIKKYTLQ